MVEFLKRPLSISFKLWLAMIFLILFVLGALGATLTILFSDFYIQEKLMAMQADAIDIASELSQAKTWQERMETLEGMRITAGTQVLLLDDEGSPLITVGNLSADGSRSGMGWRSPMQGGMGRQFTGFPKVLQIMEYLSGENLKEVLNGKPIAFKASLGTAQENLLVAAAPIKASVAGIVVLGSSPAPIQDSIDAFRRLIVYASLLAVVVATLIARLLSRQVTKPLALMHKAASRMANGDFRPIIGVQTKDELGELAQAFNLMGKSLNDHMEWLAQEKNLLKGIIEGMSDGVIMINSGGSVLYANESAQNLWFDHGTVFETRKNEITSFLGELIAESRANEGSPEYTEKTALTNEAEKVSTLTLGTQIIQVVLAPMGKSEGIDGYVAILRDVTASLRAEKSRREFLASVTHELRTPLHLVQGYLEAIQDEVIPDHERPAYMQIAVEEAKRLARLVQSLQEIDSLERGLSIHKSLINMSGFLRDLGERFKGKAQSLGINLLIEEAVGTIEADHDRLLQVFINLIDNALRHTPAGKSVRVRVDPLPNRVRFVIEDEGEGIPEQALPHIFDKFYRVDKARSRQAGGMGLGLAIVKQIVEAHGGTITVVSKMEEGTSFSIELPQ